MLVAYPHTILEVRFFEIIYLCVGFGAIKSRNWEYEAADGGLLTGSAKGVS
jgi:hypothetical protein